MKNILITICCLITINTFCQTPPTLQELIDKSTETMPEISIQNNFPHLFEAITKSKSSDSYIKHIYFGDFEGKGAIRMVNVKGVIIIDKAYLFKTESSFDALSTWFFFTNVGMIHFMKDNPNGSPNTPDGQKTKFYFALGKARELAENGYCQTLKVGLNNINGLSKSTKDLNIKQATIDFMNDELFTKSIELSKLKGCPISFQTNAVNNNSNSNNNVVATPNNAVAGTSKNQTEVSLTNTNNTNENSLDKQERIKKAFKKLSKDKDDFTGNVNYYDDRVNPHKLTGDGLFAGLEEISHKIKFIVYHQGQAALINNISIKAGEQIYTLKGDKITKNGSTFSFTTVHGIGNDNSSFSYIVLKKIVTSGQCMIRFDTQFGKIDDYVLSGREIKEIATVVEAYEAINDL